MDTTTFETEDATLVDVRAEARINQAFLRVIHTGTREQIAVMALPPYADLGDKVQPEADQLFVVVEGDGEVRVGAYELAVHAGDLVFVEAGTRHNIINRATLPMRLITVVSPPAHAPGTVVEMMPVRQPVEPAPWRAFPWAPEPSDSSW